MTPLIPRPKCRPVLLLNMNLKSHYREHINQSGCVGCVERSRIPLSSSSGTNAHIQYILQVPSLSLLEGLPSWRPAPPPGRAINSKLGRLNYNNNLMSVIISSLPFVALSLTIRTATLPTVAFRVIKRLRLG